MNTVDQQQRAEMLDNLLNLAVNCPVDHCNPVNCPLHDIRKLELGRRLEWFKALTDEDLVYLNSYHFVCLKNRLDACLAGASH